MRHRGIISTIERICRPAIELQMKSSMMVQTRNCEAARYVYAERPKDPAGERVRLETEWLDIYL